MIPVEMKYLAWVELLLIHVLVPESSFLGHLCGIAIGTACITCLLEYVSCYVHKRYFCWRLRCERETNKKYIFD